MPEINVQGCLFGTLKYFRYFAKVAQCWRPIMADTLLLSALVEVAKLNVALINWFDLIPALPQYKPTVFYGQGIKTAKGHCTIMSFIRNCNPLPYFSNPNLTFDGDKLGDVNHNVKWIRENRFLLKSVGTEGQKCEFTKGSIDWQEHTEYRNSSSRLIIIKSFFFRIPPVTSSKPVLPHWT